MLLTVTVMGCGGILGEPLYTFIDPQAETFFGQLRAATAFLSARGLSVGGELTDPNPLEIQTKRATVDCAHLVVEPMDSCNLGIELHIAGI